MTETSLGASPRVVTRVFSPKSATAEEWQAFHSYIRLRAAEEDPGEPVVSDEVRQRDMLIDWPLFEAHRVLALIDSEIVGSLAMWTRRQGTPDYEAHARHISADAGVRKSRRRQGVGRALLGELATFMREHGQVTATLSARVGDGSAFLASIGRSRNTAWLKIGSTFRVLMGACCKFGRLAVTKSRGSLGRSTQGASRSIATRLLFRS